jgi:hypothetical protein
MTKPTIEDVIESDNVTGFEKVIAYSQIIRGKNLDYWENRLSW